jgi:hypothetical protein
MIPIQLTSYEIEEAEARFPMIVDQSETTTSRYFFRAEFPFTGTRVESVKFPMGLWTQHYRDIVSQFWADVIEAAHEEANALNQLHTDSEKILCRLR